MTQPKPTTLDYAPAKPRRRMRRFIIPAALVLVAAAAIFYGPSAWRRAQLLYWQHKCLTYTAPPDQIVCEERPGKAATLLAESNAYQGGGNTLPAAFLAPECWRKYSGMLWPGHQPRAVLFIHERRSPSGQTRLVVVERSASGGTPLTFWGVRRPSTAPSHAWQAMDDVRTLALGKIALGPTPPPTSQLCGGSFPGLSGDPDVVGPAFFAGQPDPADESHFTIDFLFDNQRHTLDGYLRDDGDVDIKLRKPSNRKLPWWAQ